MKTFTLILIALVGCVVATSSISKDLYWNLNPTSSRIIGGEIAERRQFPYQVSIQWGYLFFSSHICGGTLINENWVLTAAHCKVSSGGHYQVVLGQLRQQEYHYDIQKISTADFIIHPSYAGGVATNDIALIRLRTPAKLSPAVQIAPLADDADCDAIEDAVLSGWGLTTWLPVAPVTLRWAQLPRITNEQCGASLTSIVENSDPLDDTMICTSSNPGKSQSACSGDSGGPLVRKANGKLIGVVSWGVSPCGVEGAPTVYTRVCSHLDFIYEHVESVNNENM